MPMKYEIAFCRFPRWALAEISSSAVKVWLCLDSYLNEEGLAWPSQQTIAKQTKLSRPTVIRSLHELEDKRLIIVHDIMPGNRKIYRINPAGSQKPDKEVDTQYLVPTKPLATSAKILDELDEIGVKEFIHESQEDLPEISNSLTDGDKDFYPTKNKEQELELRTKNKKDIAKVIEIVKSRDEL